MGAGANLRAGTDAGAVMGGVKVSGIARHTGSCVGADIHVGANTGAGTGTGTGASTGAGTGAGVGAGASTVDTRVRGPAAELGSCEIIEAIRGDNVCIDPCTKVAENSFT